MYPFLHTSLYFVIRSVSKVWQMSTVHYYGSMKAQGRTLPSAIEGEEDDPLQMGGDFTFRYSNNFSP